MNRSRYFLVITVTMVRRQLPDEPIKIWSDYQLNWPALIPPVRGHFLIESTDNLSIHGDAPKCFLRVKEYRKGKQSGDPGSWPKYIAKVGSKWYPVESIVEHLITRVGQLAGLPMADSRLRMVGRQARFLSRYFLARHEQLVHGIEIFQDQVGKEFVEEVASERLEREFYTFQQVRHSIEATFPAEANSILTDFVRMLTFDALIGNNDRHPANWGIITSVRAGAPARFSPIFDTARGLFWNDAERTLKKRKQDGKMFLAYCNRSTPLIGWERLKDDPDQGDLNHFTLMRNIYRDFPVFRPGIKGVLDKFDAAACARLFEEEFASLLSRDRLELTLRCLKTRREMLGVHIQ